MRGRFATDTTRPPCDIVRMQARGDSVSRGRPCAAVLAALAAITLPATTGCGGKRPTAPPAAVSTPRPVGIALTDSLGDPISDASVAATSLFDVNGFAMVLATRTDADGEAELQMRPGPWIVSARAADGRVAAGQAVILAPPPNPDSVLVRLIAHTPSRIEGHARLLGRDDHRGILVSAVGLDGALAVTDSSGAYTIEHVPLGQWSLFFGFMGFGDNFTTVTVTAPGSTVIAPDVELLSAPAPGPRPAGLGDAPAPARAQPLAAEGEVRQAACRPAAQASSQRGGGIPRDARGRSHVFPAGSKRFPA